MIISTSDFIADPDVAAFAQWMARRLPEWPVHLNLPHSPFVPGGITAQVPFASLVPEHYRWRLSGMAVGDWWETNRNLRDLARALRVAVLRDDAVATLRACEAIAQWGADRNGRVGAIAFLAALGADLPPYIRRVRDALRLNSAAAVNDLKPILRMNSTLSKIHALYAGDGLCIYESRVAAAMATFVELWRRDTDRTREPLPDALSFPAVGSQPHRRVRSLFPDAADPGALTYVGLLESATATRWAETLMRLALLTAEILRCGDPQQFVAWPGNPASGTPAARAAAFNGALFMAGYDPASLTGAAQRQGTPTSATR